jgi:hypothetical protein
MKKSIKVIPSNLPINTKHDTYLVQEGNEVDMLLPDGSFGSFRHNGDALIISVYQTRLVNNNWDDVWEGKLYEFEIAQSKPEVTDQAVEKAYEWFGFKTHANPQ